MTSPTPRNIASLLAELARIQPDCPALRVPRGEHCEVMTFRQLNEEVNRLAGGLVRYGLLEGHRVLVMIPPGTDFIAVTFALFRIGALPVLIDPGLGRRNVLGCVKNAKPDGMIGIPLAHAARFVFPSAFGKLKLKVTVGTRWFWGGPTLAQVKKSGRKEISVSEKEPDAPAAILFTSGSTGPPKGVVYTHAMFFHQVEVLKNMFHIERGDVDLPTFPLFALFGVALGMTCIIPEMDPTRPADVHPPNIIKTIERYNVVNSFGSPALWDTVSNYCLKHKVTLPTLKRVLMAGAPVPGSLLERFPRILEGDAKVFTPYGATEALPVCTIEHREILDETWEKTGQGAGTCVGRPVEGITVRIISIVDEAIPEWDDSLELGNNEIGEIVVEGPWVTREYFKMEEATRRAKIRRGNSTLHRMGDVGYRDAQGRYWFCGRKNQRVLTAEGPLYTIPCEAVFNRHPGVRRSALVGVGEPQEQKPVLVVELNEPKRAEDLKDRLTLVSELLELGLAQSHTRNIKDILFHPEFPVDVRHNAKISREQLAQWASQNLPK